MVQKRKFLLIKWDIEVGEAMEVPCVQILVLDHITNVLDHIEVLDHIALCPITTLPTLSKYSMPNFNQTMYKFISGVESPQLYYFRIQLTWATSLLEAL